MTRGERYTAEALAERVGLSVRTVRFYLRERLIDPPLGRGRGAHFDERHVAQLQRVRALRHVGLDLQTIRNAGALETVLARRALGAAPGTTPPALAELAPAESEGVDDEAPLDAATAIRIPMAEGVELLVDPDRPMASPRRLVEIALVVRKAFGRS